jgi:predicted phosphodiesterase
MNTSGLFTKHGVKIRIRHGVPVRLVIWGDVHRDSPNHAHRKWQEFLAYCRTKKDAWFLGMGDYTDSTSSSERSCLGHISDTMHETFAKDLDRLQAAKVDLLAKELSFMSGRLIGLINGNHYYNFNSGINTDQMLAQKLACKYLGVCSLIRLFLEEKGNHGSSIDLFAHHGKGASRLVGGSINRVLQQFEGVEADVAIMGHDHKRCAVPGTPRILLENHSQGGLKVRHRDTWAVRSGSFLASYEDGVKNYNVDEARPPCSLGWVELLITVTRQQIKGERGSGIEIRSLT